MPQKLDFCDDPGQQARVLSLDAALRAVGHTTALSTLYKKSINSLTDN